MDNKDYSKKKSNNNDFKSSQKAPKEERDTFGQLPKFTKKNNPDYLKEVWDKYWQKTYGIDGLFIRDETYRTIEVVPVKDEEVEVLTKVASEKKELKIQMTMERIRSCEAEKKNFENKKVMMAGEMLEKCDEAVEAEITMSTLTPEEIRSITHI